MPIDLSIIIINYNTKKLTLDAVKSIKDTVKGIEYEIIVVDNDSEEKFPDSKDYSLVRNVSNLGFAKANNIGIDWRVGKYILLLNSDTIVKRNAINKLYEFAQTTPNAGVVAPRLLNTDGTIQGSVFRLPTISRAIRQYWLKEKGLLDKYAPSQNIPTIVESVVMAAFLITPKALDKVGLLDENYFMYFEDLDYCRRINKSGLKIYYLPTSEVTHIHGGSGGKNAYLIESAKKYHGVVGYYIYTFVLWLGQKLRK